jgi:hypothetical protein
MPRRTEGNKQLPLSELRGNQSLERPVPRRTFLRAAARTGVTLTGASVLEGIASACGQQQTQTLGESLQQQGVHLNRYINDVNLFISQVQTFSGQTTPQSLSIFDFDHHPAFSNQDTLALNGQENEQSLNANELYTDLRNGLAALSPVLKTLQEQLVSIQKQPLDTSSKQATAKQIQGALNQLQDSFLNVDQAIMGVHLDKSYPSNYPGWIHNLNNAAEMLDAVLKYTARGQNYGKPDSSPQIDEAQKHFTQFAHKTGNQLEGKLYDFEGTINSALYEIVKALPVKKKPSINH